jgi:hypothetical protein
MAGVSCSPCAERNYSDVRNLALRVVKTGRLSLRRLSLPVS